MVKKKKPRGRTILYLDHDLWEWFGKWAKPTGFSRSRWMEMLMRELRNPGSCDIIFQAAKIGETFRKFVK